MADYYPLIARAVAGAEKGTAESRRAIYERARAALLAQLRSVNPPLNEQDITRERLALEEAVRKVEADAVRQQRSDNARPGPAGPRIEPKGSEASRSRSFDSGAKPANGNNGTTGRPERSLATGGSLLD